MDDANRTGFDSRPRPLEKLYKRLTDCRALNQEEKEVLFSFLDRLIAEGLSIGRIKRYVDFFCSISKLKEKSLLDMSASDFAMLINIHPSWTEHTKYTYRVIANRFLKYLGKELMKIGGSPESSLYLEKPLTWDDIDRMIQALNHPRDKAIVITLYESGARIGEFVNMRIEHLQDLGSYLKVTIHGKTGTRSLILVKSKPYIDKWLMFHDKKEGWLWITNRGTRLEAPSIAKMLKTAGKKAGINKPLHPHWFRHSRATELAKVLTEREMELYFGWRPGSRMPKIYVHLSMRDLEKSLLEKVYGVKQEEKEIARLKEEMEKLKKTIRQLQGQTL